MSRFDSEATCDAGLNTKRLVACARGFEIRFLFGAAVLTLAFVGCTKTPVVHESNRGSVRGTVSLDGKALPGGSVTLVSADDRAYRVTTMIRPDGTFAVADSPLGRLQLAVETTSAQFANNGTFVPIPSKYGNPTTSGLVAEAQKSVSTPITIELRSK